MPGRRSRTPPLALQNSGGAIVLGREQAHGGIRHRPGDRLPDVLGLALIQDGLMTTTAPMLRFPNHDEHPAILLLKITPDCSTSGAQGSLSGLDVAGATHEGLRTHF